MIFGLLVYFEAQIRMFPVSLDRKTLVAKLLPYITDTHELHLLLTATVERLGYLKLGKLILHSKCNVQGPYVDSRYALTITIGITQHHRHCSRHYGP